MRNKKDVQPITHEEWIRGFIPALNTQKPPNSFTIEEAMKATNRKRTTVCRILNDKVDDGELVKERICIDGRNQWFYYPKNKK